MALEARATELENKIYDTDRAIASEALAAQEMFKGVFISDGKKFRWVQTTPGGEYTPVEEPLTEEDVRMISECLAACLGVVSCFSCAGRHLGTLCRVSYLFALTLFYCVVDHALLGNRGSFAFAHLPPALVLVCAPVRQRAACSR